MSSAATATLEQRCTAAKHRATGKKIGAKLSCHARALADGVTVDGACLAKAEDHFVRAFAKLGGVCPGDPTDVEAMVDGCVATMLNELPGSGRCAANSASAIGRTAGGLLRCVAKDVLVPGTLANCAASRSGKLAAALTKAGRCAAESVLADLQAACVAPIVGGLSTTTTTTTMVTTRQCCRRSFTCGNFDKCDLVSTPAECGMLGGVDIGPGTCNVTFPCVTTTTPPSACCTPTSPGQPLTECAVRSLCECTLLGGRFMPLHYCSPNPCETTTTMP